MIYTCYEMVRDCQAGRTAGWRFFVANYVPVVRKLLDHYAGGTGDLDRILPALCRSEAGLFDGLEPAPERWFVAELRQRVLAGLTPARPEMALSLEEVAAAWQPLTLTEKQAAWMETMGYTPEAAGAMLRMAPSTAARIADRAAEMLRGQMHAWRRPVAVENGPWLGRAAAEAGGQECPGARTFLDVLDGRATWSGREAMERHVSACWHCIDHFCRMAEVIELLRGARPLGDEEATRYLQLLGVAEPEGGFWKKLTG